GRDAGMYERASARMSSSPEPSPRTMIVWAHVRQRILKTLPASLSSSIEYFVEQLSQTTFMALLTEREPRRRVRRALLRLRDRDRRCDPGGARGLEVFFRAGSDRISDVGAPTSPRAAVRRRRDAA